MNCLPGQKDVDVALKSIGESSKKLLVDSVRGLALRRGALGTGLPVGRRGVFSLPWGLRAANLRSRSPVFPLKRPFLVLIFHEQSSRWNFTSLLFFESVLPFALLSSQWKQGKWVCDHLTSYQDITGSHSQVVEGHVSRTH